MAQTFLNIKGLRKALTGRTIKFNGKAFAIVDVTKREDAGYYRIHTSEGWRFFDFHISDLMGLIETGEYKTSVFLRTHVEEEHYELL